MPRKVTLARVKRKRGFIEQVNREMWVCEFCWKCKENEDRKKTVMKNRYKDKDKLE